MNFTANKVKKFHLGIVAPMLRAFSSLVQEVEAFWAGPEG